MVLDVNPFFPCVSISALRVAWFLEPFVAICPFGLTALPVSADFEDGTEWWFGLASALALASMTVCDKQTQQRT